MKKTAAIVIFALAIWACHHKTVPSSEIIISNKTNTEETKPKIEAPKVETNSTGLVAAGKTIFTTRCNRCHGLKTTENYTHQQWENILKSMIPKARLNEDESKQVTAYVMANAKK